MATGRPSSLTPDVRATICDAMRLGCYQREAAQYAGVHYNSVTNWLKTGREDLADGREDTPHAQLVIEFEAAETQAVIRAVANIQRAAATDWRAALAWLARRHPDRWGERGQVAVTVDHMDERDVELIAMIRQAKVKQAVEEASLRDGETEGQRREGGTE